MKKNRDDSKSSKHNILQTFFSQKENSNKSSLDFQAMQQDQMKNEVDFVNNAISSKNLTARNDYESNPLTSNRPQIK